MKAPTTGRRSLFRGKDRTTAVKAYLTQVGHAEFQRARVQLATMVDWEPDAVSEGDIVEWVLRGRPELVARDDGTYDVRGKKR